MEVDRDSNQLHRTSMGVARKVDSLQPPIDIVGIRFADGFEVEIVGSRFERRHQLAGDLGNMSHRFISRAKDLYVLLAKPSFIHFLAPRREHHCGSGRSRLFSVRSRAGNNLLSSAAPSISSACAARTLRRFQLWRSVRHAFALRGGVMYANPTDNSDAICALARILARQAVRDHFSRAARLLQGDVDANVHPDRPSASLIT